MKIYTKVVYEWRDGFPVIVESEAIEYSGPVDKCEGVTMSALLPSILGSVASTMIGSMMQDEAPAPAPTPEAVIPTVEAPTPMPGTNDSERKAAQRRSIAQQRARQGRASTILTDDSDAKLGG